MKCVEIVAVPKGPAPLKIREAWVGLRLPLSSPFGEVANGRGFSGSGYLVDVVDAVEILGLFNEEAAAWWRTNTDWVRPGATFHFDAASGRLYRGLPSITVPVGQDGISVRDFLKAYSGNLESPQAGAIEGFTSDFVNPLPRREAKELEESALTRPIVLLLSNLLASEYSFRVQGASSEEYLERTLNEGHAALQDLYRLALEHGIRVEEAEIDRPLSFTDIGIRAGVIERGENGGVRTTEKGEAMARRLLDDQDELPF